MTHSCRWGSRAFLLSILCAASALGACSTQMPLPEPRSIIVYSGERIQADQERMAEVESWLLPELDRIDMDPSFLIRLEERRQATYPWETLAITADTASLGLSVLAPDAQSPYLVYAYLRLMEDRGTLPEILPEAAEQSDYGVERAILSRVAEVWLLGRSVYDTHPFGPLDELVYASEFGYLDDFIFATQGERFAEAASGYQAANPGRENEFHSWFQETFEAEGPQYVGMGEEEPEADGGGGDGTPDGDGADAPAGDAPADAPNP